MEMCCVFMVDYVLNSTQLIQSDNLVIIYFNADRLDSSFVCGTLGDMLDSFPDDVLEWE